MTESKNVFSDNEYTIMSEIMENENISQRELSRRLGVSVSTVNVLINKMINEGFIKMTQVSQKQVMYMLTPVGMMEKAKKTVSYLKAHYRAIYETKEKIKDVFVELSKQYDTIYVLKSDDEMGEILEIAVEEYHAKSVQANPVIIQHLEMIKTDNTQKVVLIHIMSEYESLCEIARVKNCDVVNMMERL